MQRSADLDDLDILEVVDTEIMNQEKEDEEDGLAPAPYYVPQNRSLCYKVRVTVFPVTVVLRKLVFTPSQTSHLSFL